MRTFDDIKSMTAYLKEYRGYANEIEVINSKMGIHSPQMSGSGSGASKEKDHIYNFCISRKEMIEREMRERENLVLLIADNDNYFRIIWYKFIFGDSLEKICKMIGYSLSHMQHVLYPDAKHYLFSKCCKDGHQETN